MARADFQIRNIDSNKFHTLLSAEERIKFLLRYAVLAPSTHNSQPWLFKIENNSCKIYNDTTKRVVEADPIGRDLYISFGCFLENLIIAANYFEVFDRVNYYGKEKNNLVAEVFFKNLDTNRQVNKKSTSLLNAITKRVNARGIFMRQDIEKKIIDSLISLNDFPELKLHTIEEKEKIEEIAKLTAEGLKIAYANPNFRKEMSRWMNNSISRRPEGIPGYSLRMPTIISFIFPFLIRFLNIGKGVAVLNYRSITSAPLVCVISAEKNDPIIWMKVGRLFERISVSLTAEGLRTSVFVASIEIGDLYKQVQQTLDTSQIPQMLFCVGFMNFNQHPNLRHPVESKIIN